MIGILCDKIGLKLLAFSNIEITSEIKLQQSSALFTICSSANLTIIQLRFRKKSFLLLSSIWIGFLSFIEYGSSISMVINNQECLAVFQKTKSFDLTPFRIEGQNSVPLNIEGWNEQVIYEY